MVSTHEQRNASSRLSQCKTFSYNQSVQVRREAQDSGNDDGILLGTNGLISCGTTANILVKRKGEWLTPRLTSGCLPGIMRQRGIHLKIIKEAVIEASPQNGDRKSVV